MVLTCLDIRLVPCYAENLDWWRATESTKAKCNLNQYDRVRIPVNVFVGVRLRTDACLVYIYVDFSICYLYLMLGERSFSRRINGLSGYKTEL